MNKVDLQDIIYAKRLLYAWKAQSKPTITRKGKREKKQEKKQQISYKREENYEMNSNNWLIHGIFR